MEEITEFHIVNSSYMESYCMYIFRFNEKDSMIHGFNGDYELQETNFTEKSFNDLLKQGLHGPLQDLSIRIKNKSIKYSYETVKKIIDNWKLKIKFNRLMYNERQIAEMHIKQLTDERDELLKEVEKIRNNTKQIIT